MWYWVNPDNRRYYQADLVKDLLGDWTLVKAWGSLDSNRGSQRITYVASKKEGLRQIEELDTCRQNRGYLPVESLKN